MYDPKQILRSAKSILLVDWASSSVPRTLVEAGFTVFCASPGRYSLAELVSEPPEGINSNDIVPPAQNENGYLVFRRLDDGPSQVDIVNVYRPEKEHERIIANYVVPLGAKAMWSWLQASISRTPLARRSTKSLNTFSNESVELPRPVMHLIQHVRC